VKLLSRLLPWGVVVLAALYVASTALRHESKVAGMDLEAFGRLPVHDGGRIKPLDTVARNSLMLISGKQTLVDTNGETQPAMRWLADVMVSPPSNEGPADKYKVFRIENDQVLSLLGLRPRSGFRYALEEFAPKLDELFKQAKRAQETTEKSRDLYDRKLLETAEHIQLYGQLAALLVPRTIPPDKPGAKWRAIGQFGDDAKEVAAANIRAAASRENIDFQKLNDEQMKQWVQRFTAERKNVLAAMMPSAGTSLLLAIRYYKEGQADAFNQAVADYGTHLHDVPEKDLAKVDFEAFFNRLAPFYTCIILYIFGFLLACLGWLVFTRPLHRAALGLMIFTLLVHSGALAARMYIQGRPPVTNLYSSAIFIGWAGVIFGLVLEGISRLGLGTALAAVGGALTLIIAHYVGVGTDTLEPMRAVLATNFWLATHVTCVTLGYTATFVAGGLGIAFIVLGVFTPFLTRSPARMPMLADVWNPALGKDLFHALGRMSYGVVCFATLLSFVGTVLGGIWADQSWGRFWGWDVKENGALIIVLANVLVLHARWGGLVKQRGMAVLTVFGNIVTSWSWFGVNMLGVGLHSYGFMSAAVFWMVVWVVLNLGLIGVGLLPLRLWQSFLPPPPPQQPPSTSRHVPLVRERQGVSTAVTTSG
jgi:ABC-type transport system involved in cytochrome c biogenesis permease subunit